jgi:glutamate synthase domain-containing protein 3
VVLGKCGRNFAAGMNGGIAYVLDERGDFAEKRCNTVGVDLDPLAGDDIALLKRLITRHADLTQSPRANWILENWEQMLPSFVKVFPHEYKRALERSLRGRERTGWQAEAPAPQGRNVGQTLSSVSPAPQGDTEPGPEGAPSGSDMEVLHG